MSPNTRLPPLDRTATLRCMTTETLMSVEEVRRWLRTNERDPAWLARKAGVNRSHMWRIVEGRSPLVGATRRRVTEAIQEWDGSRA